jgi:uncharacterized membrane protein YhaH (DUF805 family)
MLALSEAVWVLDVKVAGAADDVRSAFRGSHPNGDGGLMLTAIQMAFLAIELVVAVISIVATVRVITKAGYSGWWILISFVPFVNLVMFLVFAFSKWPVEQRLEAAERSGRQGPEPNGRYSWASALGTSPFEAATPRTWDYLG